MTYDPTLLEFASEGSQRSVIELLIDGHSQSQAAELLGLNVRTVERTYARVRDKAGLTAGDVPLNLTGQSRLMKGDTEVLRWDKTKAPRDAHLAPIYQQMIEGVNMKPLKPRKAPSGIDPHICSVLNLADAHIGMLAHAYETGDADNTTDLGVHRVMTAVDALFPKHHKVKHGVLLNVGDLMHFDGMKKETPQSANAQDTDTSYGGMYRKASGLVRYIIDRMLKHCETVHVMNIRGNHDESSMIPLNDMLQVKYENESRLKIPDNDCHVLTHEWGSNFIYGHHGNGVNPQQMYNAMTRDYSAQFGRCEHVWCVSGHLHNQRLQWIGKAKMEILNTLAPIDAWHASKLYGSFRSMDRVDLHINGGEIGRQTFNPVLHAA